MQCPKCKSKKTVKNGRRKDKQNYLCRDCDRQFVDVYDQRGYSAQTKQHCLTLYCNGLGFRAIERSTGVCHNTIINWVKQAAAHVPEENYEIPETAQIDELQTFVGSKKIRYGAAAIAASDARTEALASELLRSDGALAPFFER